jgi:site-specific recombinase XerD
MDNMHRQLQKLKDVIRVRHYSYRTEKTYCGWVRRFWVFCDERHHQETFAQLAIEQKIEAFLTGLAKGDCAASTQNQAFDAIRFFVEKVLGRPLDRINALRAKRKPTLRIAPEQSVAFELIERVPDIGGYPTNLIVRLLYGCGLRVSEPLKLRIKDVDFENSRLLIYEAKGNQCRIVRLPCSVMPELQAQIKFATAMWERDMATGLPVAMPGRLGIKAPRNARSRSWYFVFPARNTCPHPRTGQLVRYHLHEANVQRAVRKAVAGTDMEGIITPHNFRHGYGTHAMEAGANICDVQKSMGHKQIETTLRYVHGDGLRVRSPLEIA